MNVFKRRGRFTQSQIGLYAFLAIGIYECKNACIGSKGEYVMLWGIARNSREFEIFCNIAGVRLVRKVASIHTTEEDSCKGIKNLQIVPECIGKRMEKVELKPDMVEFSMLSSFLPKRLRLMLYKR